MKALTTIPNLELLFPLERYLYHAFTNPLKNITYKTFYTLLPFGFRLACLHKVQENTLEIKYLYNYYVKEAGLFFTNIQHKNIQQNTPIISPSQWTQS